jgi:hypothetical protein
MFSFTGRKKKMCGSSPHYLRTIIEIEGGQQWTRKSIISSFSTSISIDCHRSFKVWARWLKVEGKGSKSQPWL